ncbi:MAG: hypothetical protein PHC60_00350 [Heliobacteriaceae bacterium]|nr:hypothetical protein [Heliobacteriaceae bacterium]
MRPNLPINGLATGIGSVPGRDVGQALQMIAKHCPAIPHWPQMPGYNATEGLIEQYLAPLDQAGLLNREPGRSAYIDPADEKFPEALARFYEQFLAAEEDPASLAGYAFPAKNAAGYYALVATFENRQWPVTPAYIKGQLTGPVTLGLQLCDRRRRSAYYDPQLKDVVVKNAALQAAWQARDLGRLGYPVIIFIDEPGMYALGSSTHITLNPTEVVADINEVVDALHRHNAVAGVHVCAGTDWGVLLQSRAEIINFDAYSYFASLAVYPAEITAFLRQGGFLAWGIVPTQEAVFQESGASLLKRYEAGVQQLGKRGVPVDLLLSQTVFTPACGTGTLPVETAEAVYRCLAELTGLFTGKFAS